MADVSHIHQGIYETAHVKVGVTELIYQIIPEDTPLLVMLGRAKATHVRHEWLRRRRGTRTGVANRHRAVPPGDQFNLQTIGNTATDDFEDLAVPTRVVNYGEIFRVLPRVDETTLAHTMYGIRDILGDQVEFRSVDFAIYIEERLWNGTLNAGPTGQGDTTPWQLGGVVASITDNVVDVNDRVISDRFMQNLFNRCWANGGRPQDWFSGPNVKSALIDALGTRITRFMNQNERGLINNISTYEGATQTISLNLTRDLEDGAAVSGASTTGNRAILLDRSAMKVAWLREPFMERLPRMAGDERVRIEGQCTLEYGDERAHGEMTDIQIPADITA